MACKPDYNKFLTEERNQESASSLLVFDCECNVINDEFAHAWIFEVFDDHMAVFVPKLEGK